MIGQDNYRTDTVDKALQSLGIKTDDTKYHFYQVSDFTLDHANAEYDMPYVKAMLRKEN